MASKRNDINAWRRKRHRSAVPIDTHSSLLAFWPANARKLRRTTGRDSLALFSMLPKRVPTDYSCRFRALHSLNMQIAGGVECKLVEIHANTGKLAGELTHTRN